MASRVMHLIIADQVSQAVRMADTPRYLLGGIAPDAHHIRQQPKDPSHFLDYDMAVGHKVVNYERYVHFYKEYRRDPYFLGYLTHLIADQIWLDTLWQAKIGNLPAAEHPNVLPRYYADFRLLNGRLIEHYGAGAALTTLLQADSGIEMSEVDWPDVLAVRDQVAEDYRYTAEQLAEPLQLFTLEEVTEYIDESVRRAKGYIDRLAE